MNYLLVGQEHYLKNQFLLKLKDSVSTKEKSGLDFDVLTAGTPEINRISDCLDTLPLLSKYRIIVIKEADKLSQKEKDYILKKLKSSSSKLCIVLEMSSNKVTKFIKEASDNAKIINCNKLKIGDLSHWVKRELSLYKKRMTSDALNMLIETCGNDLFLLKSEIDKIVAFLGDKNDAKLSDIEPILGRGSSATVFKMVDMVIEKKPDNAIRLLNSLLNTEKPNNILNLLSWQFRNILKVKELGRNANPGKLSEIFKTNSFLAQKTIAQSKNFTRKEIEDKLVLILEADSSLKSGVYTPEHALERALVGLAR